MGPLMKKKEQIKKDVKSSSLRLLLDFPFQNYNISVEPLNSMLEKSQFTPFPKELVHNKINEQSYIGEFSNLSYYQFFFQQKNIFI